MKIGKKKVKNEFLMHKFCRIRFADDWGTLIHSNDSTWTRSTARLMNCAFLSQQKVRFLHNFGFLRIFCKILDFCAFLRFWIFALFYNFVFLLGFGTCMQCAHICRTLILAHFFWAASCAFMPIKKCALFAVIKESATISGKSNGYVSAGKSGKKFLDLVPP